MEPAVATTMPIISPLLKPAPSDSVPFTEIVGEATVKEKDGVGETDASEAALAAGEGVTEKLGVVLGSSRSKDKLQNPLSKSAA